MIKLILILIAILATPAEASPRRVLATSFTHMTGPNAKYNGDQFFCYKKPGTNLWAAPGTRGYKKIAMNGNEWGVAHRWLPCGTLIEIRYRGKRILVPVVDRGPYWAVPEQCWTLTQRRWGKRAQDCWSMGRAQVRLKRGYMYAGELDLTRLAARRIGMGGRRMVRSAPF